MSTFDFTDVLTKTDFTAAAIPDGPGPAIDPNEVYANRVNRLNHRISRFFGSGQNTGSLTIRVGFLNESDKAELISKIEGKGYSCSESGTQMTIV